MKILITGASSGLGAELARQYASPDIELILLARREKLLQNLKNSLQAKCKSVEIIAVDVTDFALLQDKIKALGFVDMVILNAGVSLGHSNAIPTIAEFKNLYDVNVLSNHAILEILLPLFIQQKNGKVVFMSSLASLFSMPNAKVYSSSKRALNAYAQGLRYKYKEYGVRVITILPWFIESEMTQNNDFTMPFILSAEDGVKRIKNAIEKDKEFYAFPFKFYFLIRFFAILPASLIHKILKFI